MDHDALISEIYAAASGASDWTGLPSAMCRSFGAAAFVFADGWIHDFHSQCVVRHGFDDSLLVEGGYALRDNFDPEINLAFRKCLTCAVCRSFDGVALFGAASPKDRRYYDACFVRNGLANAYGFTVMRRDGMSAGGFLARSSKAGALDARERARLDTALTHLGQAAALRLRLGVGRVAGDTLLALSDEHAVAVFVVDRAMRPLLANARAEALLSEGDGVRLERRSLRFADAAAHRALTALVARPGPTARGGPVSAARESDGAPLCVSVFPAIGLAGIGGPAAGCAGIVVRDPLAGAELPSAARVADALGLTAAEAAVARLTPLALSRRAVAERLGLSEETVKTHLAHARDKLRAESTAALALIVQRLGAG